MTRLWLCLLAVLVLGGCAGRSEMRAVASLSSAILNQSQIEAAGYADAQTRYEATAQAIITSFSMMTAIGNQEADSVQTSWVDSSMRSIYSDLKPRSLADIQKIVVHLKDRGIGVLVTDHNVRETLKITDRAYIVHDGVIFRSGTPTDLAADEDVKRIYLGAEFRLD